MRSAVNEVCGTACATPPAQVFTLPPTVCIEAEPMIEFAPARCDKAKSATGGSDNRFADPSTGGGCIVTGGAEAHTGKAENKEAASKTAARNIIPPSSEVEPRT